MTMKWPWETPEKCRECDRLREEFGATRAAVQELYEMTYRTLKRIEQRTRAEAGAPVKDGDTAVSSPDVPTVGPLSPRVAALLRRRSSGTVNSSSQ